jgi:hypothetical protein
VPPVHPTAFPPSRPAALPPGSELTIAVLTMGPGSEVWERFGHNAIVVEDHQRGTSIAYNYGMFSFRQENFLLRFIQGRMNYWMAGFDTDLDVARYRAGRRSVWRQELNLTPAQRVALRDFLAWNSRDENKYYRYDYYRDNCSTRVRDALDAAVGGAIKAQTSGLPSGTTFRFHTQRLTTNDIPIYTAIQIAAGRGTDLPLSAWEEMFLPSKLQEHLRAVRVPDDAGRMVPLVKSEETLFESNAFHVLDAPPRWIPNYLLVGLLAGAGLAVLGTLGVRSRWAGVGFGALALTWTWASGVVGTLLAGMWAFTDHVIARRNENVLQFSVLALAVAILLIPVMRGKVWPVRPARALALGLALLSVAGLLGKLLPGWIQGNGQLLALAVPINLGLAIGLLRFTRE